MRLLADLHVSPATVEFLRSLGHDVVRVAEMLSATATDVAIVEAAQREQRHVLTQDLDFSAIVALRRVATPSVIMLRLSSSRIEHVNGVLSSLLPTIEADLAAGAVVSVEDQRVRTRRLPID
jgi:predicted nuclease of predicted toxin-antitoxin system